MLISPLMFNEKLALALQQRDIKPTTLAKRTKISDAAISRYLSGEREPSVKALIAIADALNISYGEIMTWFSSGTPNLKRETLDERLIGYFKEMSDFEKEVYADSLEKRSKAKGVTNNEEKSRKPRKKVQEVS